MEEEEKMPLSVRFNRWLFENNFVPNKSFLWFDYTLNFRDVQFFKIEDLYSRFLANQRIKVYNEEGLRQLFKNMSDCYADTWIDIGTEMKQGDVVQAMTEDGFISLLKQAKLITD